MIPTEQPPAAAPAPGLPVSGAPAGWNERFAVSAVCGLLAAMIWFVFGQTLHHGFVNYDDNRYVYENPIVQKGLTWAGFRWAFTHLAVDNWHPLTWLSHMLDCELYGLKPAGHHLTNVLLHTATVILLFLVLRRMTSLRGDATATPTGALWRSAFVAAVFAIHPLRVESVAWVAERKDVLSGLFFMLTLWAYAFYVQKAESRKQKAETGGRFPASIFYLLALFFYALGLMSKPMLVTLPLVLLLLDYWPLGRWQMADGRWQILRRLVLEKLPFFALAAASCVVTVFAQQEALLSLERFPLLLRFGNAAISCVAYLGQMFWPVRLAVLYPFAAGDVSLASVLFSLAVLAGVSTWALVRRRRQPYWLTGWLWYLITLLPVIGLIQVGSQARADRYTYLPQIGIYLLLTWAAADLGANWRRGRALLGLGATALLAALMVTARAQAAHWRNSETLWTHTLASTTGNVAAHNNLGEALREMGRTDEAMAQFRAALQIQPNSAKAHNNLGSILAQKNEADAAIAQFEKALQLQPRNWQAHGNLASVLFYQKGRADEAMAHCQQALEIRPNLAQAHIILGHILLQKGRDAEAMAQYQAVLQTEPDSPIVLNNIGWILATSPDANLRNGEQALRYAQRACAITENSVPALVSDLAAAYAEAGRYDEAVAAAQHACELATAGGDLEVLEKTRTKLALYLAHQPYHRPPPASADSAAH